MADLIDTLSGMDDAALGAKIGLTAQLKEAREGLASMAKLEGKARTEAVDRLEKMFAPHVYPSEFKWIAKDAARAACKTAEQEMCDCSPASLCPDD